jgi:hypothetical protein
MTDFFAFSAEFGLQWFNPEQGKIFLMFAPQIKIHPQRK